MVRPSILPLPVRLHIRDIVESPESEVNLALKSLNTLVGSQISLEIAWDDIHRDLKKSFADDIDKLVPDVCRHITIFLNRLETLLEQDEAFQDKFLECFPALAKVLAVVVQDGLKTSCQIVNHRLTLQIPTTGNEGFKNAQASIGSDLARLFNEPDDETQDAGPTNVVDTTSEDQDWDTVNLDPSKTDLLHSKPDLRSPQQQQKALKFQDQASFKPRPLPSLQSLQRPEVLFEDLLPAFLTVKGHERDLFIEGTHAPTITLIAEYFKNYARRDMNDIHQPPRFKIELQTSNFGSGTMHDGMHVEIGHRNREWRINIAMFLAFIEGVCGYEAVEMQTGCYLYKRVVPF